ncbi:hypothetical protein HDU76_012674 [Blyttiomyces sp. JEL0837]|nr:hypothetical protein HDU76_012674 [Blyttiomyces sp. JEL0837]
MSTSLSRSRRAITAGTLKANLVDTTRPTVQFTLDIDVLELNSVRVKINEVNAARKRFELTGDLALAGVPPAAPMSSVTQSSEEIRISFGEKKMVVIHPKPFRFEVVSNGAPVVTFNELGYLHYEHHRSKEEPAAVDAAVDQPAEGVELTDLEKEIKQLKDNLKKDMWEESFSGKQDSKPFGPTSIGIDITFPGFEHVYGLPEHASTFALKTTRGAGAEYTEPYRLYNFDVFEYELDNPMALYGAIPYIFGHRAGSSAGVLWLNAAEMWVDVEKRKGRGSKLVLQDYEPFATSTKTSAPLTHTHWMAESGIVDLLIFTGNEPNDLYNSMTFFTGRPAMPPSFSIGYHQCRWNYLDEQDVAEVDAKFDAHDIPYDVLWLDIEHTDGKKYFTWDKVKFPNPIQMQEKIGAKGRKMVTIIDPHIKRDDGFPLSKEAKDLGLFVKASNGKDDFEGWCWPGSSNWIDYLNPAGRQYWAEKFKFSAYEGSTKYLYTWNDMNEPSVFNGPEITMPKDNVHYEGWEHRDIHNIYGALQQRATYEGLLLRNNNEDRPFVLSRAFFIGSQRYGSIWTGDNTADWNHLKASVPMILSIGVSGMVFAGADVGGFFNNPEPELLLRWYQAGAFQPFFRGHAHIDTKRREPWLFGEPYTTLIREAIRSRYKLLPYIYTLFWEANQNGKPIMRPLLSEFPNEAAVFATEDAFMLGSAILVHPIVAKDAQSVKVFLPPSSNWYNYYTFDAEKAGQKTIETTLESIPTYLRGGSIVPRRDRIRRASNLSAHDPFTLVVALDSKGEAKGTLYVDDGHSYAHEKGSYVLTNFEYKAGVLKATPSRLKNVAGGKAPTAETLAALNNRIERVIVVGLKKAPGSVSIKGGAKLDFKSETVEGGVLVTVKDPKVMVGAEWSIQM